jgi:uncharacterized repeat protein (TIGR03803 family)
MSRRWRSPFFTHVVLVALGAWAATGSSTRSEAGGLQTLYNFCPGSTCTDGLNPFAGLVMDSTGNLYGTTFEGGATAATSPPGFGEVFKLAPNATSPTAYSFTGNPGGSGPFAGLIRDGSGNLYGTTSFGGQYGAGAVFKLALNGTSPTVLYSFTGGSDGANPSASLIMDGSGNLYGTAEAGGNISACSNNTLISPGCGTVFVLKLNGTSFTFTSLHSFSGGADGANPTAGLIIDTNGNLYGTTTAGGNTSTGCANTLNTPGCGTVFRLKTDGSSFAVLYSFNGGVDAANPGAALTTDGPGNLYGTAVNGGSNNAGAVFRLTPNTNPPWPEAVLYSFCSQSSSQACTDGANPLASLIIDAMGNLFGTTFNGGTGNSQQRFGVGTMFQLTPTTNPPWTETVLYSFCPSSGCADGFNPSASLIADDTGNLYSTTPFGGAHAGGTVFVLPNIAFAGTPGKPNCHGKSVSALAKQYGGLNSAAAALGYPSVSALQDAIRAFCGG